MKLALILAGALGLWGSLVSAEEAMDAGAGAPLPGLRDCVTAAADAPGERACIGGYSRHCIEASPDGETTIGTNACIYAEAEAWDALLNESYGDLMLIAGEVGPEGLDAMLRAAQRDWIAFRDADCDFAVAQWGEGSMRQIAGATCTRDRTASRALELRAMRAGFGQ